MNDNLRMDDFCKNLVINGYLCKNDVIKEIIFLYCSIEMLCIFYVCEINYYIIRISFL